MPALPFERAVESHALRVLHFGFVGFLILAGFK
jgi:hypothetical protein